MYYELFNDVFEANENKICIFEIGAFYVVLEEQAVYLGELLGLIIKGDALSESIAAASIIAKVTRDRMVIELDKKYPEYNFAKNKGYGTKEHTEAIKKYGLCDAHRRSFCKKFM